MKITACHEVAARLRNSPVGKKLGNGWVKKLLDPHIANPERSIEEITTIAVPYGDTEEGWLSLWQTGGGLRVILWATPIAWGKPEVKTDLQNMEREMSTVLNVGVQRRILKDPGEWLRARGRSLPA